MSVEIRVPASALKRLDDVWSRLQHPPEGHNLDRIRDEVRDAVEQVLEPYRQAEATRESTTFFFNSGLKYAGI